MRPCKLPRCGRDLDALDPPKKATAEFCCDAHRGEWHRLSVHGEVSPQGAAAFWSGLARMQKRRRPPSRPSRGVRVT